MGLEALLTKSVQALCRAPGFVIDQSADLAHQDSLLDLLEKPPVDELLALVGRQDSRLCYRVVKPSTYNQKRY